MPPDEKDIIGSSAYREEIDSIYDALCEKIEEDRQKRKAWKQQNRATKCRPNCGAPTRPRSAFTPGKRADIQTKHKSRQKGK